MTNKYSLLNKATIKVDYLETNSTTHEFLFGALAELVDNARDAGANNLYIYSNQKRDLRGGYILNFLDDGSGMDPNDVADIIKFGNSNKKNVFESNLIGQYGNGLKSGSMRIGSDMILFTKKNSILSVVFLSKTFYEIEQLTDILVPMPSFDEFTKEAWINVNMDKEIACEKHKIELDIILKHSPFKTRQELFEQFDKITGSSGTLVSIYNLKLLDTGKPELDFESDRFDIKMTGLEVDFDRKRQIEHKSFRAYASIIYLNPHMKIYIQNKKVRTKLFDRSLHKPRRYLYISNKFKNEASQEAKKSEDEFKKLSMRSKECTSKLHHFMNSGDRTNQDTYQKELTRLRREDEEVKRLIRDKEKEINRLKAMINDPKKLEFIFGVNLENRNADGLFLYNCDRLIMMFEHTRDQKNDTEYRGVVGIVNIPYLILKPTHNKQGFADPNELTSLLKAMAEHMDYYITCDFPNTLNHEFWNKFGYTKKWDELPCNDDEYRRHRYRNLDFYFQCDRCLKWRRQEFDRSFLNSTEVPESDTWCCEDGNMDDIKSCDKQQVFEEIKLSEFKARPKQQHQPTVSIQEDISPRVINSQPSNKASKKSTDDTYRQLLTKPANGAFTSSMLNNNINNKNKKRKPSNISDFDGEVQSDIDVGARSSSTNKKISNKDNSYRNSYVDRAIVSNSATSKRSRSLATIENDVDGSMTKNEPNSQESYLAGLPAFEYPVNSANSLFEANEYGPFMNMNFDISGYQDIKTQLEQIQLKLSETESKLKDITSKHRNLLIRLASSQSETSTSLLTNIGRSSDDELMNFSLTDFMNKYERAVKEAQETRKREEKIRINNILKDSVDQDSYNQLIELFYPNEGFD